MRIFYLAVGWFLGIICLFMALILFTHGPLAGLCYVVAAGLLIPPIRNAAYKKTGVSITGGQRFATVFCLTLISSFFMVQASDKAAFERAQQADLEAKQEAEKLEREKVEYFQANRSQIIASLTEAFDNKEYESVVSEAEPYLAANDPGLTKLHKDSQQALTKLKNEKRTEEILTKLKDIPVAQYSHNQRLYKELVSMNPEVEHYQAKLEFYTNKIAEAEAKKRAEQKRLREERERRIALFGEPPTQSGWDGSYYPVERYLKHIANDPDSIDISGCTKVYHTDSGWLVGCNYRGRNGFGGMVKQANWFTIIHGTVIAMHESSAFDP